MHPNLWVIGEKNCRESNAVEPFTKWVVHSTLLLNTTKPLFRTIWLAAHHSSDVRWERGSNSTIT